MPSVDLDASERAEVSKALEAALPLLRSAAMLDVPAMGLTPGLDGWSKCKHHVNLVYASADARRGLRRSCLGPSRCRRCP